MDKYIFKRSSRSAINFFFVLIGVCLLCAGGAGLYYKWVRNDATEYIVFAIGVGSLFLLGGVAGLVIRTEWKLSIDENLLIWNSTSKEERICTMEIKKVYIQDGDFRSLVIETKDSVKHVIPGECFGNGRDLSKWFIDNMSGVEQELRE